MIKKYKSAIIVVIFLLIIAIVSSLNLYLMIENMNTRDESIRRSVAQVVESIKAANRQTVAPAPIKAYTPVKGIDYFDGATGQNGTNGVDGKSIKGDTGVSGANGKDGENGLTLEIRCNATKNRWETRYTGDSNWQIMNNESIKCTTENKGE